MTLSLRKKIFRYKVEKMITTSRFVLFFQYNSITLKQWDIIKYRILMSQRICDINHGHEKIIHNLGYFNGSKKPNVNTPLKSKISSIQSRKHRKTGLDVNSLKKTISILVCKSKVLEEIYGFLFSSLHLYSATENKSSTVCNKAKSYYNTTPKSTFINTKKLTYFFSQGPTVLVSFQSIEQAKYICEILENNNIHQIIVPLSEKPEFSFSKLPFTTDSETKADDRFCMPKANYFYSYITDNLPEKMPQFNRTCHSIFKRKHEKIYKTSLKNKLFFIGGLAENQIIDHLDLKALIKLNPFLYRDFIRKLHTPLMANIIVLNCVKTVFVRTLNSHTSNLINCLIFMKSLHK